ncbi:MAG: heparinase II/III-family protein [Thermodesulfobacteriota bacterium]|nr:heparinase II/III-family protein [Thermodesulfobacteriota bacterium]
MGSHKLATWFKLGLGNVATVVTYRLMKRMGYYRYRYPVANLPDGPFLSDRVAAAGGSFVFNYFSCHKIQVPSPPDWFVNPWNDVRCVDTASHWSEIPDFIPDLGDIKTVWELSRFDWLPQMAWAYRAGDETALGQLELWLRDWAGKNPANGGVNWKCGQEASLRCLNLLLAALLIDNCFDSPRRGFLELLFCHLQRIAPTLRYAMAQDNNHGVSEAAALFVSGHYLCMYGNKAQQKQGEKWAEQGRCWLQSRVEKLVMCDGSFSQHSVTYHRLMLDVLLLVELLRIRMDAPSFKQAFYRRVKLAVIWLQQMTDDETGDVPNLGANDGAYLFNLAGADYRDFRPSVQLGAAVFLQQSAWADKVHHPFLDLFGLDIKKLPPVAKPVSSILPAGGYGCLRQDNSFAMLRLPVYRFRPSHADALHLDLWHKGMNWVRDAGTYSYNADSESLRYYPGTASHSTVCFDNRDQMPRLGRFLFGAWLKADEIEWSKKDACVRSGYTDYLGASHVREVRYRQQSWCVVDRFAGFENEAVIHWHLAPADWNLNDMVLSCEQMEIIIESEGKVTLSLVELTESSYYLEQHPVPVLKIRCVTAGTVKTTFTVMPAEPDPGSKTY